MNVKNKIEEKLSRFSLTLQTPKDSRFGDYTSNSALVLAKKLGKNPMEVAREIVEKIGKVEGVEKIEVVAPGFINFWLSKEVLQEEVAEIVKLGKNYGSSQIGKGKKARVEFVSANPTGPLHFGNARGGPIGDSIANVLKFCGFEVLREYIDNDRGNQVLELGKTIAARAGLIKVREEELTYKGEYINELATKVRGKLKGLKSEGEIIEKAGQEGVKLVFSEIIKDCEAMGIKFDYLVHESDLQKKAGEALDRLSKKGLLEKRDGALWFGPDGVVVKSDGNYTYFTADVVYHSEKFESGYDLVIDIFGSNTSGHVPKLKALAKALDFPLSKFIVILYQFVRVKRGEEIVKMSKRAGNFVTAREVLDEVGKDAFRYFILSTRPQTHMDFDLELAKKRANENPVFYVQYAHTRISSILKKSKVLPAGKVVGLSSSESELELIRELVRFPQVVEEIAQSLEVHKLTTYVLSLADKFHKFYEKERVISEDEELTNARLSLVKATQIVLQNSLHLLGISAPEKM